MSLRREWSAVTTKFLRAALTVMALAALACAAQAQQRRELDQIKAHLDALGTPDEQLNYAAGYR